LDLIINFTDYELQILSFKKNNFVNFNPTGRTAPVGFKTKKSFFLIKINIYPTGVTQPVGY